MIRWVPLLLGAILFAFAIWHIGKRGKDGETKLDSPVPALQIPAEKELAAVGLIEPMTEKIGIGSPVSGIVREVDVRVGQKVKAGDRLFKIRAEQLEAELLVKNANQEGALGNLQKLKAMPRPEELPPLQAKLNEALALNNDQKDQLERNVLLMGKGAVGTEERRKKEYAFMATESRVKQAEAELALLKAGAWLPDIKIADAKLNEAAAQVKYILTELERHSIKAPKVMVDSSPSEGEELTVLQVNIRPGEFVSIATGSEPLMVLGGMRHLHVRIDIDEYNISRFQPGMSGKAFTRGKFREMMELEFERMEPLLVQKKFLTGSQVEKVDTRVLQAIYKIKNPPKMLLVGQQVDVFLGGK